MAGNQYNPDYWAMGMNGAMFQMIAHGISSAGMFFMVGVIYDRVHHRNLDEFGGLFARCRSTAAWRSAFSSPAWACPACAVSSAKCSSRFRVWNFSHALAVISAVGGDPDGRLHSVDDPARLPGRRIQRPARRSFAPDHAARAGHRRAAVGAGDFVRRLSASAVFLHDSHNRSASGNSFGLDQNGERRKSFRPTSLRRRRNWIASRSTNHRRFCHQQAWRRPAGTPIPKKTEP